MRETYTVTLQEKVLLSAAAACYHLRFSFAGARPGQVRPGQFFSLLAADARGKSYTRAYSLASVESGGAFDLCVNRVPGGFFSNLLCDLLPGDCLACHGPHGTFTLPATLPERLVMVAAGTGIAPFRGFLQHLYPPRAAEDADPARSLLVYAAPEQGELFYHEELAALAAREPAFCYRPYVGQHPPDESAWTAELGSLLRNVDRQTTLPYVCGLAELVKPVRAALLALGWQKGQVLFERYD